MSKIIKLVINLPELMGKAKTSQKMILVKIEVGP